MNAAWTVIIGLVIGLVARAVLPGKDSAGIVVTTLLGVCGAIVGTLAGRIIGIYGQNTFAGFTMSVLGAVALLALYRRYGTALGATQT